MTDIDPSKISAIRATGETDRSDDFKAKRGELIEAIDGMFDIDLGKRQLKYGSALLGVVGTSRDTVDDPFGGPSIMQEGVKRTPGLYKGQDDKTGEDVIVIKRPGKNFIEVRRNKTLMAVTLPEDVKGIWDETPTGATSREKLVSVREFVEDQGSTEFSVTASGDVYKTEVGVGRNGGTRSSYIPPQGAEKIQEGIDLANRITEHEFFTESGS